MTRSRAYRRARIAAIVALAVVLAGFGPVWLRTLVGVPFVLLVPGHALMLVVDPERTLGRLEWFALSLGASIASVVLLGMLMAWSWVGLSALGMVLALAAVVVFAAKAYLKQAAQASEGQAPAVSYSVGRAFSGALVLLACAIIVLAVTASGGSDSGGARVVQLWGVPDKTGDLSIGARNVDASSGRYRLTIAQGGRNISTQDFEMPTGSSRFFVVKKSAMWTTSAPITAELSDTGGFITPRTISVWTTE